MFNKNKQNKITPKKVVFFLGLFLAAFWVVFKLVNLDLKPVKDDFQSITQEAPLDMSAEFKKRLGSIRFSVEGYDEWAKRFALTKKDAGLDADPDKDDLPNYLEYVHGTNPLKADTDGDKFSDKQEISNGYDPDAPGDIKPAVETEISKINVAAPMIWTQSENEKLALKDLEKGLSHFPKTAAPGQTGNMIISGHSSNYVWVKGDFNSVFKDLDKLEKGDLVMIKTTQKNGRTITYTYQVKEKFVTIPDDERIFQNSTEGVLTLSTCWPLGTNLKRMVIKADLVK